MLYLVMGGSASGKSEYAEALCTSLAGEGHTTPLQMTYLATMEPRGDEAAKRIARHRKLRAGKGFLTLEQPLRIEDAAPQCRGVVLLETLSVLLANEMFSPEADGADGGASDRTQSDQAAAAAERVLRGVRTISAAGTVDHLVMVSDMIFSGILPRGPEAAGTLEYVKQLGFLHCGIARFSDHVIEVGAGLPVIWK